MTSNLNSDRKIVILSVNTFWNAFNFRLSLIKALIEDGYHVVLLAKDDRYIAKFQFSNCTPISLNFSTNRITPIGDLFLILQYLKIFFKFRPSYFLAFTIKPNIYGSFAAKFFHIPVINNIAGLGRTFNSGKLLKFIAINLYKISLSKSLKVFFQNTQDMDLLLKHNVISQTKAGLLPGSGVDINIFKNDFNIIFPKEPAQDKSKIRTKLFCDEPQENSFSFMLISRLLKQKGIKEYIEAAKLLKLEHKNINFYIVGLLDEKDSNSISLEYLQEHERLGVIKFLGGTDDVRDYIFFSDCIVLPTYYNEGRPKILLEAGAMATPVIATDWVGCRDIISDGFNGFLCKPMDSYDLKQKMVDMILLEKNALELMGNNGRIRVEQCYSDKRVIKFYQDLLSKA